MLAHASDGVASMHLLRAKITTETQITAHILAAITNRLNRVVICGENTDYYSVLDLLFAFV